MLSFKEHVETGQGKPSSNDIKIDNWVRELHTEKATI